MTKLSRWSIPIGAALALMSVIGVYAANISGATYKGAVRITNNGSTSYNQSATFTLNTTSLINSNFVNTALNNTAILNNDGLDNPFMPGAMGNWSWVTWVGNISGPNINQDYTLYMGGNQSMNSSIAYFPGAEGMSVAASTTMNLGANWTVEQDLFVDTSAGSNKTITNRLDATNTTYWNMTIGDAGVIIFYFRDNVGPFTINASGISTGYHNITANASNNVMEIIVDGVSKNSTAIAGTFYSGNPIYTWQFGSANTTPYIKRVKMWKGGNQTLDLSWQYIAAGGAVQFTDASGNGNTAVPTFLNSGTSANITANLTGLTPVTQTVSPVTTVVVVGNLTAAFSAPPNLYTELNIQVPGAGVINDILDGVNIPRAVFWFPVLFGFIGLIGLLIYWLSKSMLIQGVVMGFVMILLSLMGGFGYWVCIEFIIMALAFILGSKQFGF